MNKKGFTLIELLAVIIILGILMIIAIPSVTKYINDSRKNSYIDTAKELISGARNLVNDGKLEMYDTDATYYIDIACIKTENGGKAVSPYGDFVKDKAYVIVTFDGKGYDYYWTSIDDSGQGVKNLIKYDNLDPEIIESDLKTDDIKIDRGLDGRSKVILIREANNCQKEGSIPAGSQINGTTGEDNIIVCKRAIELHTARCQNSYYGCKTVIGYGSGITYGTKPTGAPKAGDAYDCDVNNDGVYDDDLERFYYVKSEGSNSILIFHTNTQNGVAYYGQSGVSYDTRLENWHGPTSAIGNLPSTSQWSNPGIIYPDNRTPVNEDGGSTTDGTHTIESISYFGKAARILTYQEVLSGCNNSSDLNNCNFFLENIGEYTSSYDNYGYWLETPTNSNSINAYGVNGSSCGLYATNTTLTSYYGTRPAITVKTSAIE